MVNLNWANPPFPVDVAPHHMPPQEYLNDLFRFLAVQDATLYSEDKIDKKILSTGR